MDQAETTDHLVYLIRCYHYEGHISGQWTYKKCFDVKCFDVKKIDVKKIDSNFVA